MLNTSSGLVGAPVTKTLLALVSAFTVLASAQEWLVPAMALSPAVLGRGELWRLLSHPLLFASLWDLLLAGSLLYSLRLFERQLGSAKYLMFLLVTTALSTALLLLAVALAPASSLSSLQVVGPYGSLFAALVLALVYVPVARTSKLLGVVPVSDKVFAYLLWLQLAYTTAWEAGSLLVAASGVLSGILYVAPVTRLATLRFPRSLRVAVSAVLLPLLDPVPIPAAARHNPTHPTVAAPPGHVPPMRPPTDPSPAQKTQMVQTLVAMGFDAAAARQCLAIAHWNVDHALNLLTGA
eukprot:TRINITY_DN82_c0_g2_i1.p1 TRINITY_DN82_c0_g2~~TRINITY_DN82_c0_g2_i1.p1  ORF type:complete len:303 (+),score=36.49 TRINITY_DN82_c0_g2_i1:27-911(+)